MSTSMRKFFRMLNKYFMVPMFRLGFGPFFGNPFSGYIMVMKAVGRKSGKIRFAPVNYFINQGHIYCVSGARKSSDWYQNLLATPEVEVILPGGAIFGRVGEVTDSAERLVASRGVLKNGGFAAFFEGYNPWKISDDELAEKITDLPVLKIQPVGIGNGASDPAGWAWIWTVVVSAVIIAWLVF